MALSLALLLTFVTVSSFLSFPLKANAAVIADNALGEYTARIEAGDEMYNNYGTISENAGHIVNNYGTILTDMGSVDNNYGAIRFVNDGNSVENNYGNINTNSAYPATYTITVTNNYQGATVYKGAITNNYQDATVYYGAITNNYGGKAEGGRIENNFGASADGSISTVTYQYWAFTTPDFSKISLSYSPSTRYVVDTNSSTGEIERIWICFHTPIDSFVTIKSSDPTKELASINYSYTSGRVNPVDYIDNNDGTYSITSLTKNVLFSFTFRDVPVIYNASGETPVASEPDSFIDKLIDLNENSNNSNSPSVGEKIKLVSHETTTLRLEDMKYLAENSNIEVELFYNYEGVDYHVIIPAGAALPDENIDYYGPLWLAKYFSADTTNPNKGRRTYTVQSGDTLKKIAMKFNTSVSDLIKMNPSITDRNVIYVGQVINY